MCCNLKIITCISMLTIVSSTMVSADIGNKTYFSDKIRFSMKNHTRTTNIYDHISADIMNTILNESYSEEFVDVVKMARAGRAYSEIKVILDSVMGKGAITQYEECDLSLLSACRYGDFSYITECRMPLGYSGMFIFINQPLDKGELPLDVEKWEPIILKELLAQQVDSYRALILRKGSSMKSSNLTGILWLSKYARSEESKRFLLFLAFDRAGWLHFQCMNPSFGKGYYPRLGLDISDEWASWYVDEIIKPSGLYERFKEELQGMALYHQVLSR
ncbi:MAG: hypothetical protein V5783_09920 [Pontiella sp.]